MTLFQKMSQIAERSPIPADFIGFIPEEDQATIHDMTFAKTASRILEHIEGCSRSATLITPDGVTEYWNFEKITGDARSHPEWKKREAILENFNDWITTFPEHCRLVLVMFRCASWQMVVDFFPGQTSVQWYGTKRHINQ